MMDTQSLGAVSRSSMRSLRSHSPENQRGPRTPEERMMGAQEAMLQAFRRELTVMDESVRHRFTLLERHMEEISMRVLPSDSHRQYSTRGQAKEQPGAEAESTHLAQFVDRVNALEQSFERVGALERKYVDTSSSVSALQRGEMDMQQTLDGLAADLAKYRHTLVHEQPQQPQRQEQQGELAGIGVEVEAHEFEAFLVTDAPHQEAAQPQDAAGTDGRAASKTSTTGAADGGGRRSSHVGWLDLDTDAAAEGLRDTPTIRVPSDATSSPRVKASGTELTPTSQASTRVAVARSSTMSQIELSTPIDAAVAMANQYKVKESVWDVALFMAHPSLDALTMGMLLVAIFSNVILQVSLCIIVYFWIAVDPWPSTLAQDLEVWRGTAASDKLAMLCAFDPALSTYSAQAELAASSSDYTAYSDLLKVQIGPMLCSIVIFFWTLKVGQVVRDVGDYSQAMLCLHWNSTRRETRAGLHLSQKNPGVFAIDGVTTCRLLLSLLTGLLQIFVAVILLVGGSLWLVYTKSIMDLMLNAVALSYIMDLDELIYNVMVPRKVKALVRGLEPIELKLQRPDAEPAETMSMTTTTTTTTTAKRAAPRAWPMKSMITLVFAMGFETLMIVGYVIPHFKEVTAVKLALCPV